MITIVTGAPHDVQEKIKNLELTNNVEYLGQSSIYRERYPQEVLHMTVKLHKKETI